MRLIRLSTNQESGYFKNLINEDILIKPQSKVALLNCSISFKEENIVIDDDNNELEFQLTDDPTYKATVSLINGIYKTQDFLKMFNHVMNISFPFTGSNIGSLWDCNIRFDKMNISLLRSLFSMPSIPTINMINTDVNILGTTDNWFRNGGTADTFDAFFFSNDSFINSCGTLAFKVKTKGEFFIGLSKEKINPTSIISESTYNYGIYGFNNGTSYVLGTIYNGVQTLSIIVLEDDHQLNFNLGQNSITIAEKAPTSPLSILANLPYYNPDNEPYYLLCNMYDDICKLKTLRWTADPRKITNYGDSENDFEFDNIEVGPPKSLLPIKINLKFTKPDLQSLLGYNNDEYNIKSITYDFIGDYDFKLLTAPNSVIIELPNLPIQSYDGSQEQQCRRPILAIIPQFIKGNEEMIYNANVPIFINIDNKFPISLREFTVKITSYNDDTVLLNSGATITLLLED